MKKLLSLSAALTTIIAAQVNGADYQTQELSTFLKEFHANPAKVMNQLPAKKGASSLFSSDLVQSKDFINLKSAQKDQQNFCQNFNGITKCLNDKGLDGKAGFVGNDKAEYLVDSSFELLKNLNDIDKQIETNGSVLFGKLDKHPWSDDYWAIANGILGYRYADSNAKSISGWKKIKEMHLNQIPANYYVENNMINLLSPSEKYDLLIGDDNYTLTQAMWAEGARYWTPEKDVERWMGICHGWAPAAYMMERPQSAIEVTSVNGLKITFYPSDIKALASLLWAKESSAGTKFIGGRCNVKNPKQDKNGRIQDNDCFDSNPGTWHEVVVNQIKSGPEGRSFVMDATYDYEVWNQPVYSYHYRYFNPITGETSTKWENVRINIDEYNQDSFKKYRSKNAKYIVGVDMEVDYVAEAHPRQRSNDSSDYDVTSRASYRYDLEVAYDGEIIGGEWYTNAHPDFLWTPEKGSRAQTALDKAISNLKMTKTSTPKEFLKAALYQSGYTKGPSYEGSPLAKIVEELIRLSNE